MDPSQWGVDEAFKTLESITEGSSAAKGALQFLRHEITRLREDCRRWENARNVWMAEEKRLKAQVEELSIHAEKWVKRATTPAHEREPPHCSTCSCPPYQAPEPAAEHPDTLLLNAFPGVRRELQHALRNRERLAQPPGVGQ